jgi:hypothetical protein
VGVTWSVMLSLRHRKRYLVHWQALLILALIWRRTTKYWRAITRLLPPIREVLGSRPTFIGALRGNNVFLPEANSQ